MQFTLTQIGEGARGTDQTIKIMESLVESSQRSPWLRERSLGILRSRGIVDTHDPEPAARAIFEWVKSNVSYIHDPVRTETVQDPEVTLRNRAGDCDDHSIMVAALAENVGIPARFVVVGADSDQFEHILPELFVRGQWLTADTAESDRLGTPVPRLGAIKSYSRIGGQAMAGVPANLATRRAADVAAQQAAMYRLAKDFIELRWRAGRVHKSTIAATLARVDRDDSLIPPAYVGARRAVGAALKDFLLYLDQTGAQSPVTARSVGVAGLDGFFADLWGTVKQGAGDVWSAVKSKFGDQDSPIVIQHETDYTIPIMIAVGLAAVILITKK